MSFGMPLLDVRNLCVHFSSSSGSFWKRETETVRAVDDVSFQVEPGQTVGLVGESGCGKSTTARAILGLTRPTSGEIWFEGKRIDGLDRAAMRPVRQRLQMIFQDPFGSLNPRMTIGQIVSEPMEIFSLGDSRRRKLETLRLLDLVGLNAGHLNRY
ncbi:MAG TPA: ATP-binding cassette domain-containing protein, partial [Pirellulales bacterium]